MAQRERFATPPSRHGQQSDPPSAFMVGQVPIDAQELGVGVIDDPSKVLPGVLTSALANPLDTPGPPNPASFVALTGIISDGHAYIRLSWDIVPSAAAYEIRWKLHTDTVYSYARSTGAAFQINGLLPNASYDWGIAAINAFNNSSGYGADSTSLTAADTTAPAVPASVAASAGVRSVIVTFTANTEVDLDHYVIEVYSDAGLTTLVKTFTGLATVWAYTNGTASTQYWARVKAVDTSGNSSAWAATVTATTGQIANSDIQAGTITADRLVAATITAASGILADAVITTAKIADLAVTNAKINDLAVGKLTAGSLSAAVILTGSIKSGTSGVRFEEDASGIRLYGYQTPYLRATGADGSGTGAVTVPLPALHLTNDILLMRVYTEGDQTAPSTPTGWTKKDEVASGAGVSDPRLTIFYKRDGGAETAPVLATTSSRQIAFIEAWAGCTTSGDPFDATATSFSTSATLSASITGVTTLTQNTAIVQAIAYMPTVAADSLEIVSVSNSSLSLLRTTTQSAIYTTTGGRFGYVGAIGSELAAVGASGTTVVTLDTANGASRKAMWTGALKADIGATVNLDSTSGNGTFSGVITGARFYSPRQTGDRGVYGLEAVAGFLGSGVTVYRSADTEGPNNISGVMDFKMDHSFPAGAGTGNQTSLILGVLGSDNSDKSTGGTQATQIQQSYIELLSGQWKGPVTTYYPQIDFVLNHVHSDGSIITNTATLYFAETTGKLVLSGVQHMPNMPFIGSQDQFKSGSSTRANTAYGPLASADGPAVTVAIGLSGMCLVGIDASLAASANAAWMSFAGSGANTIAAIDQYGINTGSTGFVVLGTKFTLLTGLSPGNTTFGAQYKNTVAGTITAANRHIIAIPL